MFDKQLIEKYLNNSCSAEEANTVLTWFSSAEGIKFVEDRIETDIEFVNEGNECLMDHPVRSVFIFQKINAAINKLTVESKRTFIPSWIKIAATIIIPLLLFNVISWYVFLKPQKHLDITWQEVYVPKGEKLQVLFQDGSKAWLNSDTHLKYPNEFSGSVREVKLEGEAYFIVKKNPRTPFVVQLKSLDIKVTGTSFNVKAYSDEEELTTSLDEGKVSLFIFQNNKKLEYLLKPGQQATYLRNSGNLGISSFAKGYNSAWKENRLIFKDTPLAVVVKVLERYYNVPFVIDSPNALNYTYTITFHNETLKEVLFALEKITPITCNLKNGMVVIKKRKDYRKR